MIIYIIYVIIFIRVIIFATKIYGIFFNLYLFCKQFCT